MDFFYSASTGRFYSSLDKRRPKDAQRLEPMRGRLFYDAQGKGDKAVARGEPRDGFIVTPEAIEMAIKAADPDPAHEIEAMRRRRNQLLAETDHWFVADRGLSDDVLQPWREYRQQLRDLDLNSEVDWPVPPGGES